MAVIYLAHQYAAPTKEEMQRNRQNAAAWAIWIARTFGVAVSADWLWWTENLEETPEGRELGLHCDDQSIVKCDEFWMVGGRVSSGMERGRKVAIANLKGNVCIRDLTLWGFAPPVGEEHIVDVNYIRHCLCVKGLIS